MRERLIRTGKDDRYDAKWGRFILNVDKSPLPFAVCSKTTYELSEEDQHQIGLINQPGSGLVKHQCALQVCFRPIKWWRRLGIIFRGTCKRISNDEKGATTPILVFSFKQNAWAGTTTFVEWVERTLCKAVADDDRFGLFCNNLMSQVADKFKEAVS